MTDDKATIAVLLSRITALRAELADKTRENEFKYSHRIQAEDRSHRIGQVSPVTYIDIISNSGIDHRINLALSKKQDVVKSFREKVKSVKDLRVL